MTAPAKTVRTRSGNVIGADDPFPCQIYEIWGVDPWDRGIGIVCLWVGETARFPLDRLGEHFGNKYWRYDIRLIKVHPTVYPTKGAVWVVEEKLTHELQPVHSWEYNQDNPWVVRNGRGVHKRLPRVPEHWLRRLNGRAAGAVTVPAVVAPSRLGAWWLSIRPWVIGFASSWFALTDFGIFAFMHWLAFGFVDASKLSAILAAVLVAASVAVKVRLWWLDRQARKRRQQRARARRQKR